MECKLITNRTPQKRQQKGLKLLQPQAFFLPFMARKLKEYLLAAVVLVFLGSRREAFVSVPSLRTGRGATAPTGRTSPRSVAVRAHWGLGPLGPVESAAAFRIYFLPFVDPLEIDETLIDQLFGGWFGPLTPLLLGLLVFWVQSQINAVRREQEGRVIGSAAKAVGDAAAKTATGAAQSLTERLGKVPAEQWFKLLLCLALDLAGADKMVMRCYESCMSYVSIAQSRAEGFKVYRCS